MREGDAFKILATGDDYDGRHLWVVVSDPKKNPDRVVIVNLNSIKSEFIHDPACMLDKGDHPFVHHPTYVNYQLAREYTLSKLTEWTKQYKLDMQTSVSSSLLARIRLGAAKSKFLKKGLKKLLSDQGIIPPS